MINEPQHGDRVVVTDVGSNCDRGWIGVKGTFLELNPEEAACHTERDCKIVVERDTIPFDFIYENLFWRKEWCQKLNTPSDVIGKRVRVVTNRPATARDFVGWTGVANKMEPDYDHEGSDIRIVLDQCVITENRWYYDYLLWKAEWVEVIDEATPEPEVAKPELTELEMVTRQFEDLRTVHAQYKQQMENFKSGLCAAIWEVADEQGISLCDPGVQAFCEYVGIPFVQKEQNRRFALKFDLHGPGEVPYEVANEARDAAKAVLEGNGYEVNWTAVDDEEGVW